MRLPLVRSAVVLGSAPGAGQTLAATALVRALCRHGVRAVGMQPVARAVPTDGGLAPSDELRLLAAAGALPLPPRALAAALLPPAPSDAQRPTLADAVERFRMLATWADAVVVDGAGSADPRRGTRPLDLAQALAPPLVLVAGLGSGGVDAALATLALLQPGGLMCAGWIGPDAGSDDAAAHRRLQQLRDRLPCRLLGTIPPLPGAGPDAAAGALDIALVLQALADPGPPWNGHAGGSDGRGAGPAPPAGG